MLVQGAFEAVLFTAGLIIGLIYHGNIYAFLIWIRDSLCERDSDGVNRASGKSISSLVLVILLVSISLFICRQGYLGEDDFKPNQKELLIVIIGSIESLIIFLYGLKLMGKAKVAAFASAIFSKLGSNRTDTPPPPSGNNGTTAATDTKTKAANKDPIEPEV